MSLNVSRNTNIMLIKQIKMEEFSERKKQKMQWA